MTSRNSNFDRINDKNLEQCVVNFLEKVDSIERSKRQTTDSDVILPARAELRTLELWRSIISECLASFLYVFIVCGAKATTARDGSFPHTSFVTAAASGFTMTVLTYCFQHLSGAHVNPATTVAMATTRRISPTRGILFVSAQVGGGVAGAALLFGVSLPSNYGSVNATMAEIPSKMMLWEKFCIEFVLTFLIVFTYCGTINGHRKWLGSSPICIGFAYLAACLVASPTLNPARAFGPAFVMNSWDHHWVFWLAPCAGGIVAALVHEIIFNTHKRKSRSDMSVDGDSMSIHSEADTYDDHEKHHTATMRSSMRANDNPIVHRQIVTHSGNSCCTSLYPAQSYKMDRTDPIYEGSRSLYTRSPPLTRANLSRSQSVYAKGNTSTGGSYGVMPQRGDPPFSRPGPLIPTQSMYPMSSSLSNATNQNHQNHQNQQKQGTVDCIYNGRNNNPAAGARDIYMKQQPGRSDIMYNGMKNPESNDVAGNSYRGSMSTNSKTIPVHTTNRKESHSNHQSSAYYRSQPSPPSQY